MIPDLRLNLGNNFASQMSVLMKLSSQTLRFSEDGSDNIEKVVNQRIVYG